MQCKNGHMICDKCFHNPRMNSCPMCRVDLDRRNGGNRNLFAEQVMESLKPENMHQFVELLVTRDPPKALEETQRVFIIYHIDWTLPHCGDTIVIFWESHPDSNRYKKTSHEDAIDTVEDRHKKLMNRGLAEASNMAIDQAIQNGVKKLKIVVTDDVYCSFSISKAFKRCIIGLGYWKKNGWKTSNGASVYGSEHFQKLFQNINNRSNLTVEFEGLPERDEFHQLAYKWFQTKAKEKDIGLFIKISMWINEYIGYPRRWTISGKR